MSIVTNNHPIVDHLPDTVTVRAKRRCGHCRAEGHDINHCTPLTVYIEELYYTALTHLRTDIRSHHGGYSFEIWVTNLATTELKYLSWRMQNDLEIRGIRAYLNTRITDTRLHEIVFAHFGSLNLGYIPKSVRLAKHYYAAYRAVQSDVANQANGSEFQNYLRNNITQGQLKDIYNKILETRRLTVNAIEDREFDILWEQWNYNHESVINNTELSVLNNTEFIIHCHFASIEAIGYDFRVENMPGYISRNVIRQHEQNRLMEIRRLMQARQIPAPSRNYTTVSSSLNLNFQENHSLKVRFYENVNYQPNYICEYKLVKKDVLELPYKIQLEEHDDCAVCMETKPPTDFIQMNCNHAFCNMCVGNLITTSIPRGQEVHCPLCRNEMREIHYSDYSKVRSMFSITK